MPLEFYSKLPFHVNNMETRLFLRNIKNFVIFQWLGPFTSGLMQLVHFDGTNEESQSSTKRHSEDVQELVHMRMERLRVSTLNVAFNTFSRLT